MCYAKVVVCGMNSDRSACGNPGRWDAQAEPKPRLIGLPDGRKDREPALAPLGGILRDQQREGEGDRRHGGADGKDQRRKTQSDDVEHGRDHYRCDVVDGEADAGGVGDVRIKYWVSRLLARNPYACSTMRIVAVAMSPAICWWAMKVMCRPTIMPDTIWPARNLL
jgi:hypothetical protein